MKLSRFFSVIPVLAWLFIQLVMTGGWSTAAAIGSAENAGQAIVICTGDGLVTIYLDENGDPIEGEDGKTPATHCDWCLRFSAPPTLTAPVDLSGFAPCDSTGIKFAVTKEDHSPQAVLLNARIRAPPVWAMS